MTKPGDIKVEYLDKDYRYFMNRNTFLFGASNSGKSTVLFEILYLLRDHVPNIFYFCPTADSNQIAGIVPPNVIFPSVDIEKIGEIFKHQYGAAKTYQHANKISGLRRIFRLIDDVKYKNAERRTAESAVRTIQKIKMRGEAGAAAAGTTLSARIGEVIKIRDDTLRDIYKRAIRENRDMLMAMKLDDNSQYVLKYLDYNPNCVIVFDDCGAELKQFQKDVVMKKILFQGRHFYINLILTLQDDMSLDSALKKNSFVNIFTTSQCAMAYFDRANSNFTRTMRIEAKRIAEHVLTPASKKDYRKLVYLRDDPRPFRYTIAGLYKFRFGSAALWKLHDEAAAKREVYRFADDPLLSAFRIDL